jgi:polysaccharide chain length determinant protein (PEP-CTERM system associated)
MVRNGEISLSDAKRVLKRFWWILPVTISFCTGLAVLALKILPKRYTSQTVVLVTPPTVSADIIRPVVSENLGPRLASMQQQILSRTRLEPVIQKYGLYNQGHDRLPIDELVTRLRNSIEVAPIEPMAGTSRELPGFSVKVTFDDPLRAQQICGEITSMFMGENSRARVEQGQQATSFLTQQLEDAKGKLDAQDAKLAQFKQRYLGSLPDQEQTNLSLLMGMNSQLEANTQALSRAQQDKAFNESLLNQQEASWRPSESGQNPVTVDQQLAALEDQLAALRSKYTDEHPDVIKLKAFIADLKKQIAAQPRVQEKNDTASLTPVSEPPQIQQLRAKLHQDNQNIADLTKRQEQIQEQIRILQSRVQSSPAVEQQYKELTRNYQTALDFYNSILKNREQASMSTNLEQRQESEQFRVLDPPSLPDTPSFPKKPLFLGGGAGAGLALGLGILFLLAVSDKSLHTERDVETYLKLPVLALVPRLDMAWQEKLDRSKNRPSLGALGIRA